MPSNGKHKLEVVKIPDFWSRLRSASSKVLALDYDGTLAPFRVNPMEARPLPGIRGLLSVMARSDDTTLAIISGRPVHEVVTLLGELEITIIGSHGFEHRLPEGEMVVRSPGPEQLLGLERAASAAVRMGFEDRLEIKVASVAFHTRGIAPQRALAMEQRILDSWPDLTTPHSLQCRRFNGGVEIRSIGFNKGDAIVELLSGQPRESLNVYIGDDDTDEDAFKKLAEGGLGWGIKVGDASSRTAARGLLASCEAVRTFLAQWLRVSTAAKNRG